MSGEDFFSRWSRRKREVRQTKQAELRPPEPHQPEPAGETPGAIEPAAEIQPEAAALSEPELSPEELEQLPSLDALTPETDLSGFLRKGVPQTLRNAALRRMWSLDPAIRDHVGDARDYAWDWNVPGDVPGYGPLAPTDDIYATLDRMFSPVRGADEEPNSGDGPSLPPECSPASGQSSELSAEGIRSDPQDEPPEAPVLQKTSMRLLEQTEPGPDGLEPVSTRSDEVSRSCDVAPQQSGLTPVTTRLRRHGRAAPD